ncbi:MAG: GPW/gp25 family protein [Bacteroides sp.]|nr:GPW/gp25 family protein [Bacteroides sp.]
MSEFTGIPLSIQSSPTLYLKKEEGDIDKCIDSILDLIVFTPKGAFSADPDFGFEYWNHEFSNLNVREFNNNYIGMVTTTKALNDISRKQCEESLRNSILTYEPRLHNPEVKIELILNTKPGKRNIQSKYEMKILIAGKIDDGLGITRPYEKRIAFMVEPIAHRKSI